MKLFQHHSQLSDAWATTHLESYDVRTNAINVRDAADGLINWGMTCDSPLNTYSMGKPLGTYARKFFGKRLDYIFFSSPLPKLSAFELKSVECKVVLTGMVPGRAHSYSDHFGVEATLLLCERGQQGDVPARGVSHDTSIQETLQALIHYYRISRRRSRSYIITFSLSMLMLFGIILFSIKAIKPWILPLVGLAIVFSWSATTFLYTGFLFGRWEANALINAIEELQLSSSAFDNDIQSQEEVSTDLRWM
jgi:sphingomyelin phosphodiesterase 2